MRNLNHNEKSPEELMREIVAGILQKMEAQGFKTSKGTNTYVLANVVADFASKLIHHRTHELSALGIWGSNDLRVIVPILFARYRIYNTRHSPVKYNIGHLTSDGNRKFGEPLFGYGKLVCFAEDSDLVVNAVTKDILISDLSNDKFTPLGVRYEDLYEGSRLTLNGLNFWESYMSQTGVYSEEDFVILPDDKGMANFYPIRDFSEFGPGVMNLRVLLKHPHPEDFDFPKESIGFEVTPDFLKFTLTQAMSKFAIFRGISLDELFVLIKEKYQKDFLWLPQTHQIAIDVEAADIMEIQQFTNENLHKEEKVPEIIKPSKLSVTVICGSSFGEELIQFIKSQVGGIFEKEAAIERVYHLVDVYFSTRFLTNANFMKSQHPVKITAEVFGDGDPNVVKVVM